MSISSIVLSPPYLCNNILVRYPLARQYKLLLTNNVVKMNVASSCTDVDIRRESITHVTIGSNIDTVMVSCFCGCTNLTGVTTYDKLKNIGDYAFKDCVNLKHIDCLTSTTNKLYDIGISAFANTGLEHISISLSGTSVLTLIQSYAFANCRQLKSVKNVYSNYLADYEFANCPLLTSVLFANSHSYGGEYVFLNCTALKSVTIPPNTFGLNVGMFKGCTSLTSVTFDESPLSPSLLKFDKCLRNFLFDGTAIENLVFPSSITSWLQFDDYTLANMPLLKSITFKGMPLSNVCIVHNLLKEYVYETHTIYIYKKTVDYFKGYGIFSKSNASYNPSYSASSYFKVVSEDETSRMISYCKLNSMPILLLWSDEYDGACGNCKLFMENTLCTQRFLDWVKNDNEKCIVMYGGFEWSHGLILMPGIMSLGTLGFVCGIWYWKDSTTGVTHLKRQDGMSKLSPDYVINTTNSLFVDFTLIGSITYEINASIILSHMFGLNRSVQLFGNDSTAPIEYVDDETGQRPTIVYSLTVQVDKATIDDFRYGQWYGRAEALRYYADYHHLPVLVEFGSTNCAPCVKFHTTVFNNMRFLQWAIDKRILLCRVNEKNFVDGDAYYVANKWAIPGDYANGKMPILMLYWNLLSGATDGYGAFSDALIVNYAHFNDASDTSFPYCPLVYDIDSVIDWLESTWNAYYASYIPSDRFNRPSITSYIHDAPPLPRYNIYANLTNDTYGRYFPVASYSLALSGINYNVSVRDANGQIAQYALNTHMTEGFPPDGTYLCFIGPMPPLVDLSWYETHYDMEGVMFKIGAELSTQYLATDSFNYGAKPLESYLPENGIYVGTNATLQSSIFHRDYYLKDDAGNPTTNIDPNSFDGESIHNIVNVYSTSNVSHLGYSIGQLLVYLSVDVSIGVDSDGDPIVMPTSGAISYVMASNWYYIASTGTRLQWLLTFKNY